MREIGLYIHIPFCIRKCLYCDFLSFPADEAAKRAYAAALIREMEGYEEKMSRCAVTSIFIGGGTPSTMPVDTLRDIMDAVKAHFHVTDDVEITMEMNPGTVTEEAADFAAEYLTRVSLGAQSFSSEELKKLGRIHTPEEITKSVKILRAKGIFNINLDLMSGLPGQNEENWERTLKRTAALDIPHISAYSLIVEEGTPFYRMQEKGLLNLPDEDTEREMYHRTKEILAENGYRRYEISNYAKEGYTCRHNCKYWRRTEYLGLGTGASSFFEHMRFCDTSDMQEYIRHSGDPLSIRRDVQHLSCEDEMEEFMFLGLRLTDGVSGQEFEHTFGKSIAEVYGPVLDRHIEDGVLKKTGDRYALTDRGVDVSNIVLAEYLFD